MYSEKLFVIFFADAAVTMHNVPTYVEICQGFCLLSIESCFFNDVETTKITNSCCYKKENLNTKQTPPNKIIVVVASADAQHPSQVIDR